MNLRNRKTTRQYLVFGALLSCFVVGCAKSELDGFEGSNNSGLPKLDFHKPKTLADAVGRLRIIHDAVNSDQAMPKPKKFKVLEVIHGTGASAHSHYYLAGSDSQSHDDHDDHGGEVNEKHHEIVVDTFAEFQDIANWLPKIAAATDDINSQTWAEVNKVGAGLTQLTTKVIGDEKDPQAVRDSFRAETKTIGGLIEKLETIVASLVTAESQESS